MHTQKRASVTVVVTERGVARVSIPAGSAEQQIQNLRLAEAVLQQVDALNRAILETRQRD